MLKRALLSPFRVSPEPSHIQLLGEFSALSGIVVGKYALDFSTSESFAYSPDNYPEFLDCSTSQDLNLGGFSFSSVINVNPENYITARFRDVCGALGVGPLSQGFANRLIEYKETDSTVYRSTRPLFKEHRREVIGTFGSNMWKLETVQTDNTGWIVEKGEIFFTDTQVPSKWLALDPGSPDIIFPISLRMWVESKLSLSVNLETGRLIDENCFGRRHIDIVFGPLEIIQIPYQSILHDRRENCCVLKIRVSHKIASNVVVLGRPFFRQLHNVVFDYTAKSVWISPSPAGAKPPVEYISRYVRVPTFSRPRTFRNGQPAVTFAFPSHNEDMLVLESLRPTTETNSEGAATCWTFHRVDVQEVLLSEESEVPTTIEFSGTGFGRPKVKFVRSSGVLLFKSQDSVMQLERVLMFVEQYVHKSQVCYFAPSEGRGSTPAAYELPSPQKYDGKSVEECPICLGEIVPESSIVQRMPVCEHFYHSDCIREWLVNRGKSTCPLCRDFVIVPSTERGNNIRFPFRFVCESCSIQ
jgi:hypothetical protein